MKKSFVFLMLSFICLFSKSAFADYWDTGWIEFKQPDGTMFIGRILGDEFEFQNITKDGYPFEKNPKDNYYYYAQDTVKYKYILSEKKVGIDKALGITRNLKVTMDQRPVDSPTFKNENGLNKTATTTYTLKVILVEFSDIGGTGSYAKSDYEDMLSGSSYTLDPNSRTCYGSMDHYYDIMSDGNISIDATVQNSESGGLPVWITLPNTKYYYYSHSYTEFFGDAETAASSAGINTSTSSTTKIAYIYADVAQKGGLNARRVGNTYTVAQIHYYGYFAGIGPHCHEFGHILGFSDLYDGSHPVLHWCLMGNGNINGTNGSDDWTCPAPINPHYREQKGWISISTPSIPNNGINLPYDEDNPTVYKVTVGSERYYIENRRYEDFSQFCPGYDVGDGGILVWHYYSSSSIQLIEADGSGPGEGGTEGYGDVYPGASDVRNLNDFTSPANSNKWYGSNSNVILHDISNPASTMTAIFGNKWFGEIPEDLTWDDDVEVAGDISVPSDIDLTISTGSTVTFEDGTGLTVNGTLQADGTTFTSANVSPSAGDWDGIYLTDVSSSSSIEDCTIEYAYYGIYCDNSDPVIDQNTIQYCTNAGIWLEDGSTPDITTTAVSNCLYGIVGLNSGPYIEDNLIEDNSRYGMVFTNYCDPLFYDNTIQSNGWDGAYFHSNCDPEFGANDSKDEGHNEIINNDGNGIWADDYCTVWAGCGDYAGYNAIYGSSGYDVRAESNSSVIAENNYWGQYPASASQFYEDGTSTVNYDFAVDSDPGGGSSLSKSTGGNGFFAGFDPDNVDMNNVDDVWMLALYYQIHAERTEALETYKFIVQNFPDSEKAKKSITKIFHLSEKQKRNDLSTYLNNLSTNEKINNSLKGQVLTAAVAKQLRDGDYDSAEKNCLILVDNYPDSDNEIYALYNLVNVNKKLNHLEGAQQYVDILQKKYPDHILTCFAQASLLGKVDHSSKRQDKNESEESNQFSEAAQVVKEYKLQAAYPNPFNPSTTISYKIPEDTNVVLKIFNTTGQEIATLVNGYQQAGSHQVRWDGKDDFGNHLPSGIYLYQIISGKFKKTGKMMLVK